MNLDDEEMRLLRGARRAMSPSPEDETRVRGAVHLAVLAGAGAAGLDPSARGLEPSVLDGAMARLSLWGGRAALVSAVAVSAGAGYWAGLRAGRAEGQHTTPGVTRAPAPEVRARMPEVPLRPMPEVPVDSERSGSRGAVTSTGRNVPPAALRESEPSPAPPEPPLATELRILRRVERLLREQNPRYALSLLGDLDREVPEGQLMEERRAAFAAATCGADPAAAASTRAAFETRHPRSVYQGRVEEACKVKVEPGSGEGAP